MPDDDVTKAEAEVVEAIQANELALGSILRESDQPVIEHSPDQGAVIFTFPDGHRYTVHAATIEAPQEEEAVEVDG